MKKHFLLIFALLLSLLPSYNAMSAEQETALLMQIDNPQMVVNGEISEIDPGFGTAPTIRNERTLVPIRAITEVFGGNAAWDEASQTVTLSYGGKEIRLAINSTDVYINGELHSFDTAPQIIGGRTMVPVRLVADGFDFSIGWNGELAAISIANYPNGTNIALPAEWQKKQTVPDSGLLRVHFIDVGQGDSIFAELPNGETLLIDGGPYDVTAADYISSLGYSHINYVVATHPDADHITGLIQVLEKMTVDIFYIPEKEHTTQAFEQLLNAVTANGCNAVYARAGGRIIDADILSLSFIAPVNESDDNNSMSAVVRLVYKNNSFLFTGDADFAEESDILASGCEVKADVLKVGHHGSETSTSEEFLGRVNPQYAVISVGKNSYGHPTERVLSLLEQNNVTIFRTDEVGTIMFDCDGSNYTIRVYDYSDEPSAEPDYTPPAAEPSYAPSDNSSYTPSYKPSYTPPANENTSQTVYRTKTGEKYHRDGCQYLKKSKIPVTVAEAQSMGLTPCSKCKP